MTTSWLRLPSPLFTVNRVLTGLLVALVGFFVLLAAPFGAIPFYLSLLVATVFIVRSVPVQPGTWLSRQRVRRGLVVLTAALTASFLTPVLSGSLITLILLGLCDLALGRATQRIGSAESYQLDERQEAIRNRAHWIAYPILAVSVGATMIVAEAATPATRQWLGAFFQGSGAEMTFVELLFFLPAMIIAWLEPDRIGSADMPQTRTGIRGFLAVSLVVLCVMLPFALALTAFVAPIPTSSYIQPQGAYIPEGSTTATGQCSYFGATKKVGYGVTVNLPLSAVACWDGKTAFESWGMNDSDCLPNLTSLVNVTRTVCSRTTDANGTLRFTYGSRVTSPLIPFAHRDVALTIAVTKDGKVVQFP